MTNKKLLLVEDNKANTALMTRQLKMLGVAADIAGDGAKALEMFKNQSYDLIVTDCNMPVMDGYELARQVRSYEELTGAGRIGIVAITADALDGTAEKCYDAGMDEYMTKPVEVPTWKKLIAKWLDDSESSAEPLKTQTSQSTALPDAAQADASGLANINKNALVDLLGIDEPEILSEYYLSYVESADEIMQDLQTVYQAGNWPEVGGQGHKLKSSSRAIGADDLADTCLALERAGKNADAEQIHQLMSVIGGQYQAVCDWIKNYTADYS